jgi:TonB family protein
MNSFFHKSGALLAGLLVTAGVFAQIRPGSSYHDWEDSERVSAYKDHISFLASNLMEGRAPGSDGEVETAEYLRATLEQYGVDVISGGNGDTFGIRQEKGDTLTSRNVIGFIQGYDKHLRDHYIVIGARMDNLGTSDMVFNGEKRQTIYYGANGNASGMAMLLEVAKMLQTNAILLRRSVLLIGWGASTQGFAGSWYFLNRSFRDVKNIDAMINLDAVGTGSLGFYAYTSSNPDLDALVKAKNEELQPITPTLTSDEPFPSDHRSFYEMKIPSVTFTTGRTPELGTGRDTPSVIDYANMEREQEYIYSFAMSLINGPAPVFNAEAVRKKEAVVDPGVIGYHECDFPPTFLGSSNPATFMDKWVYAYLKYPEAAVRDGIQGKVLVAFVIDEKGKVRDVRVLKGVDPLLDDEAVRVVAASPDWKAGRKNGKRVASELSVYVEFRLQKKGTFGIKK